MTTTPAPAPAEPTQVDGVEVLGSLSPSRAGDFLSCPLLYRFRTVDRLPEEPSPAATRGTLVHLVLERLFDAPAVERTPEHAQALLLPAWQALLDDEPSLLEMFTDEAEDSERHLDVWLASCRAVLDRYFTLEDPTRLEPADRELYVESLLESRLLLRGIIDRLDVAADGSVRLVDYKSGRAPGVGFEARALFQLRFYALVLWRTRGVLPTVLQLVYLGNGEVLRYEPDVDDLLATERKVEAVWRAIREATETGDWQPHRSALCSWCSFQSLCPEFGGTPPPIPQSSARGTSANDVGGIGSSEHRGEERGAERSRDTGEVHADLE